MAIQRDTLDRLLAAFQWGYSAGYKAGAQHAIENRDRQDSAIAEELEALEAEGEKE